MQMFRITGLDKRIKIFRDDREAEAALGLGS
jgi:hypothetical protein